MEKKVKEVRKTDVKKTENVKREKYIAEKKTTKKDKKQGNIFKRIGKYFKGVGLEIKRIRWTSGKELVKYSIASIVFVIFFGVYFYGIDWIALLVRSLAN